MKRILNFLPYQILIACILGFLVGSLFGEYSITLEKASHALITLMKMAVLPYLCFSILNAFSSLKQRSFALIRHTLAIVLLLYIVAIGLSWFFTYPFFSEIKQIPLSSLESNSHAPYINSLSLLIENAVPITLSLSLLVGLLFTLGGAKTPTLALTRLTKTLETITFAILRLIPLAIIPLIASEVGQWHPFSLRFLSPFLVPVCAVSLFAIFFLTPYLIRFVSFYRYRTLVKVQLKTLLIGFTTGSVIIALPFLIRALDKLSKENSSSTPARALAPLAGLIPVWSYFFYALFFAFTLFSFQGNNLGFSSFFAETLSSFTIFSSTPIQAIQRATESLSLSSNTLTIFLESFTYLKGILTCLSLSSIFLVTTLSILSYNHQLISPFSIWSWKNTSQVAAISLFTLFFTVFYTPNAPKVSLDLEELSLAESHHKKVYLSSPKNLPKRSKEQDRYLAIKESKTLRVGYDKTATPFSYFNKNGELVGYDISFAVNLAKSLGVTPIFIPIKIENLTAALNEGEIDIAMSAISYTKERADTLTLTAPVLQLERVVTVRSSLNTHSLKELNKVAVLKGSSYEASAHNLFSSDQIVPIANYDEFINDESLDGAYWTKEESLAWVKAHPQFVTMKASPSLGVENLVYALPKNTEHFAAHVQEWLDMQKINGFALAQFEKWIQRVPKKAYQPKGVIQQVRQAPLRHEQNPFQDL